MCARRGRHLDRAVGRQFKLADVFVMAPSPGRLSPPKRHRPASADDEAEGSVSPKHPRVNVDEGIGDAIAAKAAVKFSDDELARLFARDL